jgi:hypothetical protein
LKKNKKIFIKNRSKKIERRKHRKRKANKKYNKIKKYPRVSQVIPNNYYKRLSGKLKIKKPKPKELWAPQRLSLQFGYSQEVLKFINNLKSFGNKHYHIHLRLDNVTEIGEGAIAMLLSVINELTPKNIFITGKSPDNLLAKNTLEKSGFFRYMKGNISPENLNTKNIIIRTGDINTSQNELSPEMPKAMETVWGEKGRCPELFGTIGEMLRNACDHAFTNGHKIVWHLGVSHLEAQNTVKFSFVDNGIGIIKNYNNRNHWTKVKAFFRNNAAVLENAYKQGIESQTGLPWRGEGLPTIYELYNDKIITNLVVITNDVYLDFDKNIFQEINVPFSGTYYFWKIDKTCKPAYFV